MFNVVTRFDNGMTNNREDHILADLPNADPTKIHTFFTDFDNFVAAEWVITETQAGATQSVVDGDGGLLALVNSAADDDLNAIQWAGNAGSVIESFLMAAGKKAWFSARLKVSDATQSDFVIGLQIADTTPLSVTDGIFFQKDDGDTQLDFYVRKDATTGSTSATNIATVVSDTFLTVSWFYDGISKVFYAVNGVVLGSLSGTSAFLPDAALAPSIAIQNGDANARTLTVDFLYASKER